VLDLQSEDCMCSTVLKVAENRNWHDWFKFKIRPVCAA